jgi:hypothetical protein
MRSLPACLFVAFLLTVSHPAESADVAPTAIERIEKQIVPKLVSAVGELGNGRIDAALEKFQEMMGRKFQKTTGPFGQDEREVWQKMFTMFPNTPPRFECVDLIGTQAVSTQAFKITVVAGGKQGPILFQFRLFEYRGKVCLVSVHFDSNWNRIEMAVAAIKTKRYTRYPLPVEQTAKKSGTTKRK